MLCAPLLAAVLPRAQAAGCGPTDVELNQPATASSLENASFPASAAVDGNTATRWSSAFSDPQWLQVNLGSSQQICEVTLDWETAYATAASVGDTSDTTAQIFGCGGTLASNRGGESGAAAGARRGRA